MSNTDFVKELRLELFSDGDTLKWWYNKFIAPAIPKLKYSNFIRKMNIPEEMTDELRGLIENYLYGR